MFKIFLLMHVNEIKTVTDNCNVFIDSFIYNHRMPMGHMMVFRLLRGDFEVYRGNSLH